MTPQQIFNKVAKHLFRQGERSYDGNTASCMYRGPNGMKCAVGIFITDKQYSRKMETLDVLGLKQRADEKGFKTPKVVLDHFDLLSDLQGVHDNANNWLSEAQMKESLTELAVDHNLDTLILVGLKFPCSR